MTVLIDTIVNINIVFIGMPQIRMDIYVLDTLMRDLVKHDHQPSAYVVYLHLWFRTYGSGVSTVRASYRQLAEWTGLSKSSVQMGIRTLARRKFVRSVKNSPTATPEYTIARPWRKHRI